MYICLTCKKEFNTEDEIRSHLSSCWREKHPYHKSKTAPKGKDIITREVNDDIANFFKGFV